MDITNKKKEKIINAFIGSIIVAIIVVSGTIIGYKLFSKHTTPQEEAFNNVVSQDQNPPIIQNGFAAVLESEESSNEALLPLSELNGHDNNPLATQVQQPLKPQPKVKEEEILNNEVSREQNLPRIQNGFTDVVGSEGPSNGAPLPLLEPNGHNDNSLATQEQHSLNTLPKVKKDEESEGEELSQTNNQVSNNGLNGAGLNGAGLSEPKTNPIYKSYTLPLANTGSTPFINEDKRISLLHIRGTINNSTDSCYEIEQHELNQENKERAAQYEQELKEYIKKLEKVKTNIIKKVEEGKYVSQILDNQLDLFNCASFPVEMVIEEVITEIKLHDIYKSVKEEEKNLANLVLEPKEYIEASKTLNSNTTCLNQLRINFTIKVDKLIEDHMRENDKNYAAFRSELLALENKVDELNKSENLLDEIYNNKMIEINKDIDRLVKMYPSYILSSKQFEEFEKERIVSKFDNNILQKHVNPKNIASNRYQAIKAEIDKHIKSRLKPRVINEMPSLGE